MNYKIPSSMLVLAALAACGGSTSSSGITLDELNTAGQELSDAAAGIDNDTIGLYDEASLIAKGSASYTGHLLAGVNTTNDIFVGRTTVDVNFADGGSISGEATDFVTFVDPTTRFGSDFIPIPEGTEISAIGGTLTYDGGTLGTDTGGFGALDFTMNGTFNIPADLAGTESDQEFAIGGRLLGAVTDQETFLAEGNYTAIGSQTIFNGFAVIIAE